MIECPSCAAEQPESARFCASCGHAMTAAACGSCSAALLPGARFCNECGAPQGPGATPPTGGEAGGRTALHQPVSSRRVTSVLFGDLVGFTTISESRDHEEMRELLTRYFDECRQIVDRYGGTVEKFIGDAVMAVWGVPTAHEDDAERAVRAGLELVAMATALGQDVAIADFAMRVGIVTGEVAVTVGAEQQGMVAGDAVNTAARVQTVAEAGQVWVDETTRLLTHSAITYLGVGSHRLKGKTDPMPLWAVQAVVASVGGAQRADGLEAPLVGRDRELRLLKEVFHSAEEAHQPRLLVMVGEPGVGKSRLGWEFEKYIDGLNTTVRWHSGRCVAYGEGLAFFALAEAIRPRLRALVPDGETADEASTQDQTRLLQLGLETYVPSEQERDWLRPRLAVLLGAGAVASFPREDLFAAWTVFLERVGAENTVTLLIDDAQHADDGLLQFVEHLLAAANFGCLVVLLTRPGLLEEHPALATNRRATVSHLAALDDRDIATLLDGLVLGVPEAVRTSLVERSEGVPLFAVETVRSLIDRDLVVPRGGRYVLADPEALDLDSIGAPASLQALIAARLDALAPDQRRLVERCSVIGNAFSRTEIDELCADLGDVEALLAGLTRQQILGRMTSRFSADFGQYHFVQSVVRQVAYATLSRRDRRALHLAVATQTEATTDPAGDLAPIIAQHYLSAVEALPGEPDVPDLKARARAELERAAVRARSLGAVADSANHLLAALDLADDELNRARLHSLIAWALADAGEDERTREHALRAEEVYDASGDAVAAGLAAAARGLALASSGDNAGALEVVRPRWEALLDQPGADLALLELAKVIGLASSRVLGSERRDVLDRRIMIAERVGNRAHLADSLTALALSYSSMGSSETATILMGAAATLARNAHQPVALARCLSNLASEYNAFDLARGVEAAREGVEVADQCGVAMWQYYADGNLLLALLASGQWRELESLLARDRSSPEVAVAVEATVRLLRGEPFVLPWTAAEHRVSDDASVLAWTDFAEAQAARVEGRDQVALEAATRAVMGMFQLSGVADDFVHMWPVAAELALSLQDHDALTRLLDLVDGAAGRARIPLGVRAHRSRIAGLLSLRDDPKAAEQMLRSAISDFTDWGTPHYRARTEGDLAALLQSLGRTEEAATLSEGAVATLTEIGAQAWLSELISVQA